MNLLSMCRRMYISTYIGTSTYYFLLVRLVRVRGSIRDAAFGKWVNAKPKKVLASSYVQWKNFFALVIALIITTT